MKIECFTFNMFSENTYVLYDDTLECVIIDPGCYEEEECTELKKFIADKKLKPVKLLYTHCHIDHVLGNHFVLSQYNIPAYCHSLEMPQFISVPAYAPMYGFNKVHIGEPPTLMLNEGDEISFGTTTLHCIFAPGHSPGSICFYNKKENVVIGGDVLFRMSIGRTDLPGGNHNLLLKNIREKLFTLPEDTTVYAGHMEPTTIGFEKMNNPYL